MGINDNRDQDSGYKAKRSPHASKIAFFPDATSVSLIIMRLQM